MRFKNRNPLSRLSFGWLIFILCGFHLVLLLPFALSDDFSGDGIVELVFVAAVFDTSILLSVWIGLGGRISPWRLVVLVVLGMPVVYVGSMMESNFARDVPVMIFFFMLSISSVLLTLRFIGWQMRRVRHPGRLRAWREVLRRRKEADRSATGARPAVQFTLQGMIAWTVAWAVVLGSLSILWEIFDHEFGADSESFWILSWFALFSAIALWTACGIGFAPLRFVVFMLAIVIGCTTIDGGEEVFPFFCIWTLLLLSLIRVAGFRFLRVAPRLVYETAETENASPFDDETERSLGEGILGGQETD